MKQVKRTKKQPPAAKAAKIKGEPLSTFEQEMLDPTFKAEFEKEYKELALKELILAMSKGDRKSVRSLAKLVGLHPNAIQNLRTGKTTDIKLTSFVKIANAYGYSIELVKGNEHIPVHTLPQVSTKYELA
jgi:hypothetical protein